MPTNINELKEIWTRTDEYFQFSFEEYSSFGKRIKKWRELNDNISQRDLAKIIYDYRYFFGLENDDVSNITQKIQYEGNPECKPIDFDVDAMREQKKKSRIETLRHSFANWEKDSESCNSFSMTNIRILKLILGCDYEFLFCEANTPHRNTDDISNRLGLNISTIEKLLGYNDAILKEEKKPDCAIYEKTVMAALDKLISNDDLMVYMSWYLTNIDPSDDEYDDETTDSSTIVFNRPFTGMPSEDDYLDGRITKLGYNDIHLIYWFTLCNKLNCIPKITTEEITTHPNDFVPLASILLADDNDSFGERLKKWREHNQYTQKTVAELIHRYRVENNIKTTIKGSSYIPDEASILRTYQNWESKKNNSEIRISMQDLQILKKVMGCDYEYLFGEINTLNAPIGSLYQGIRLQKDTIAKLELLEQARYTNLPYAPRYSSNILTTIDLIVSDDDLLSYLAYYLSDLTFQVNMGFCEILRPMNGFTSSLRDYSQYLYKEDSNHHEIRDIFLPMIFKQLLILRKKHYQDYQED